jgi:crotonobetainyl-CoA:carnitine CoA-transferase CaiB-like acyl-CoA transferase
MSKTPPEIERGAPLVGEQTREILSEFGFGTQVDDLISRNVVAQPESRTTE